jgi:peptidyl-prolyl cis-trans isomerase SurA
MMKTESAPSLFPTAALSGRATRPFVIPSEAEGSAVFDPQSEFGSKRRPSLCHPDRSEAEWRDLQFSGPLLEMFFNRANHDGEPALPGSAFRQSSCEKQASHRAITLAAAILLASILSIPAWAQQPAPATIPPGAVVLDHVVAVINGSVILESDVQEEMNYAVLQPFSVNSARNTPQRALQRLIDRALILQQMKTGGDTVPPPTPEELQQQIHQLRGLIPQCVEYRCQTEAGWQAFLSSRGLTEKEVEKHWAQRMLILSFIQARFGSGVRITPAEIKNYYDKTLVPRLNGVTPPPLANVSTRIEEILLQQRVSSLLLEWLQSLKSEGSVSILDPAYGKVGTTGSGDESESGGQS